MSREDIDRGHVEWLDAMKANDARRLGELVTEDAILMPHNQEPVSGRQSIIDWFTEVVQQARTTDVDVPPREVIIDGRRAREFLGCLATAE
jgi:ketosteroid isomerase-like protein